MLWWARLPIVAIDLERPDSGRVRIALSVDSSAGRRRIVEDGDSLTTVAFSLLERAPVERLADAFREMVEPARV